MPYKDVNRRKEKNKIYSHNYYNRNKERILKKNKKIKYDRKLWLEKYKENLKCEVCGESDPACLVFHHINPDNKKYSVGNMPGMGMSVNTILKEIDKCIVLCSNCHLKLHKYGEQILSD